MNFLKAEIDRVKRKADTSSDAKLKFVKRSEMNRASYTESKALMANTSTTETKPKNQPVFFNQNLSKPSGIKSTDETSVDSVSASVARDSSSSSSSSSTSTSTSSSTSTPIDINTKSTSPDISSISSTTTTSSITTGQFDDNSHHQIKLKLRRFGEPIHLFGESLQEKSLRLRKIQLEHCDLDDRQKNIRQDVLKHQQQDALLALEKGLYEYDGTGSTESGVGQTRQAKIAELRSLRYTQDKTLNDFDSPSKYVLFCLKRWMYLWECSLSSRETVVSTSAKGQQDTTTQLETRQYLLPLFSLLKSEKCDSEILGFLTSLCQFAQEREYLKAHEVYLTMAIGNAPWPMGVSSVGIHARAAREKIGQTAHVLNDEVTRKYIQSVKRLLSFCQEHYPTDPSKMFKLM